VKGEMGARTRQEGSTFLENRRGRGGASSIRKGSCGVPEKSRGRGHIHQYTQRKGRN